MTRPHTLIRPELVFLILTILSGAYLVVVVPPFQMADEDRHFFRAWQISEGTFVAVREGDTSGGVLPQDLVAVAAQFDAPHLHPEVKVDKALIFDLLKKPYAPEPRAFTRYPNTSRYSPICYLPQVAGIIVGRACGLSVLGMMYAGRFAALLCWILVVLACIRIAPVFKWTIALVALLPMSVGIAASLSADMMTNACAMLLCAAVIRAAFGPDKKLDRRWAVIIVLLCILVSLAKQAYFPLAGLVFLLPSDKFSGTRARLLFCATAISIAVAAAALWYMVSARAYVPFPWTDPSAQLSLVTSEPLRFLRVLAHTLAVNGKWYMYSFVGALGWADTRLPIWIYWTWPLVLVAAALLDKGQGRTIAFRARAIALSLSAFIFLELMLVTYLTWDKVGSDLIHDAQGRYFLPMAVSTLLVFYNQRLRPARPLFWTLASLYAAIVLLVACSCVYTRYYV